MPMDQTLRNSIADDRLSAEVSLSLRATGDSMAKIETLSRHVSQAISHYWRTRQAQSKKQAKSGKADQGARSAVTGGAQMDGFIALITDLMIEAGADEGNIFHNKRLELPGFFRPIKEWDLLMVKDNQLILALEAKSQVDP